jgi:hypothetical protein
MNGLPVVRCRAIMKCKNCDYALWNLTEPRCPECGTGFDVQQYWFAPGSVIFKCPFCQHPHEGRDARGLPFDAGKCEGCGQLLVVEQMAVQPADFSGQVDFDHDDDFSPLGKRKKAAGRKTLVTVVIAVAVFILFVVLMYFLSQAP